MQRSRSRDRRHNYLCWNSQRARESEKQTLTIGPRQRSLSVARAERRKPSSLPGKLDRLPLRLPPSGHHARDRCRSVRLQLLPRAVQASEDRKPPWRSVIRSRRLALGESESEQARAQQHKARRGYRQKSIRHEIMIAHNTPANPKARPNLLKLY